MTNLGERVKLQLEEELECPAADRLRSRPADSSYRCSGWSSPVRSFVAMRESLIARR